MDMKRFEDLADAWGGNLLRWPDDVREEAEALLQSEPSAAAYLSEAARLDLLLNATSSTAANEWLEHRIMKAFPMPAFEADWRRPAMAAAAALVIGVAGGYAGGAFVPWKDNNTISPEYADAFDGLTEDWSAWEWSDA